MKKCELCKFRARTFCESDQASLCWDCDAKVHGANFLVARHTRTLLCRACHSLTPWKASGASLRNTLSLCQSCSGGAATEQGQESQGGNHDDRIDTHDEEDHHNQFVPWSSTPPPDTSSSNTEESVSPSNNVDEDVSTTLKRRRPDNDSQNWNLNNRGYERSELERGSWLVKVRRRKVAVGRLFRTSEDI